MVTFTAIGAIFFFPAIAQNNAYHLFADCRSSNGIANCYNVISNFPFIIIGAFGIFHSLKQNKQFNDPTTLFFIGICLTGFGSSYYHADPCTSRLIWDRIPMTISFMSFFSLILGEFVRKDLGKKLVIHLIGIGILSVLYWYNGEQRGKGDLRFYALVQFLPLILIPIILLIFKNNNRKTRVYWLIILLYALAKLCEHFDESIFSFTTTVSGHTLKHLIAGIVPIIVLFKSRDELIQTTHSLLNNRP
jgi:putative effector of murein hydrolase LrgA (UPF0299 family)